MSTRIPDHTWRLVELCCLNALAVNKIVTSSSVSKWAKDAGVDISPRRALAMLNDLYDRRVVTRYMWYAGQRQYRFQFVESPEESQDLQEAVDQ